VIRAELPAGLREIADRARNPQDSIEVLLETHLMAGVPRDSKVVAWRLQPEGEQP
jgi:hypothetical protein